MRSDDGMDLLVRPCHINFTRSFSSRNDLWIVDKARRMNFSVRIMCDLSVYLRL